MSTSGYGHEPRRRLNLSIRETLIAEARSARLNLSRFLETQLEATLAEHRAQRWREENREAIDAYNGFIREQGVWSDGLRKF